MAKVEEGAKFVRYFGPLLDALRSLGGSAKAEEAVDRVAADLKLTDQAMSYEGVPDQRSTVTLHDNAIAPGKPGKTRAEANGAPALSAPASDEAADWPQRADGSPDFGRMNSAQRLAYDRWRLTRMFG